MPTEIERKFRVRSPGWRDEAGAGCRIRQGYLCNDVERSVRVRTAGDRATLTVKGRSRGARRPEFEYAIPLEQARHMLEELCLRPLIEKTRYRIEREGLTWEVDEFHGENRGLVVAEVELDREDRELSPPDWLGEEVTGDPRYLNARLVDEPYADWEEAPA